MQNIKAYYDKKLSVGYAKRWKNLIGDYYRGGGGGTGRVTSCSINMTVYHQASDGATNYHECPEGLKPYLQNALMKKSGDIIEIALKEMESDLAKSAKDCTNELEKIQSDMNEQP